MLASRSGNAPPFEQLLQLSLENIFASHLTPKEPSVLVAAKSATPTPYGNLERWIDL